MPVDRKEEQKGFSLFIKDFRAWLIAGTFSLLFAAALLFGAQLDTAGNVDVRNPRLWVSCLALTVVFTMSIRLFWLGLDVLQKRSGKRGLPGKRAHLPQGLERYAAPCTFFFLLLCWLPVFLAVYPGFFVYDAHEEYLQVATRTFTTHHPLPHVLLLGGIVCGVHKLTGSYNLGIACYTLLQMLLVAGCFTFLLSWLRRKGKSPVLRLASLLYLGLFPTVVMFVLCSTKDTLFTLSVLLLLICLWEMGTEEAAFFAAGKWQVLFVFSSMMMMLFRNNGFYAFLVMIPILLFFQKRYRRRLLALTLCAVMGYFLVNGGLKTALHAQSGEHQEILTVPIQQLARTYKYAPEAFSPEDKATLHEVLSEDALRLYTPRLSDPVKIHFDNEAFAGDKAKYAALWLRIGMKKPLSYLNAWWMTSYGFWYPDMVINVYQGHGRFTFTYEDSSYFGYEVERPGVRESKVPWLDEVYRKLSLEVWKEKVPVVSWLFSPGAMFWLYAFLFACLLYRKRYQVLLPFLPVFLLWLTVLLGPTYLPRYVLFFWFALPLFLAMTERAR